jgi:CHAD domain-containing protein
MKEDSGIRDYAIAQLDRSLTILASQVQRAAERPGADEIHDLRVSIRRFSQSMQLFADFFPKGQVKKIRGMLKGLMRLTSAIRDRDIALDFLSASASQVHRPRLQKERTAHQRQFSQMLRRWNSADFTSQWRNGLSLGI